MLRWMTWLALTLMGCSDDEPRPPAAGADAAIDATAPGDGAAPDAPNVDGGPGGCAVGESIELARDAAGGGFEVSAAGGPERFAVLWAGANGDSDAALAQVLPSAGPPGEVRVLADGEARTPAVAAMDGAWLAAWAAPASASAEASLELFVRTIPMDGSEPGDTVQLTDDEVDDVAPALVGTPTAVVGAWLRGGEAVAAATGQDGTLSWGPVVLGDATGAPTVGLGRLDDRFYAAWAAPSALQLRVLRGSGALPGEVVSMATGSLTGEVALTGAPAVGAVLYGLQTSEGRRDLRLQQVVAPEATASTASRLATNDGVPGRSPALVRFAGAWAGAWRAGIPGTHHVRLGLFAIEGDALGQRVLAPLVRPEGDLALAVASDGTLLVVWDDAAEGGASVLRAIRMACRG